MFKQINVLGNSNAVNVPLKPTPVNDQKIKKSETMSRKSSFGNLLQANNEETANYVSASTSKTERLDIKRLAKVYTKTLVGSWISDTTKETKVDADNVEQHSNQKLTDDDNESYGNDTINVSINQGVDEDVENNYSADQKKSNKYYHFNSKMKIKSTNFKYDCGKDIKTLRANNESTILLKSGSKISVEKCNNVLVKGTDCKNNNEIFPDSTGINSDNSKSMVLTGFPKNVGVSSIVSNIFGGKLEKIIPDFHFDGNDMYIKQLYVTFVNEEDALSFLIFSKTGLFIVCGCRIAVQRFSNYNLENDSKSLSHRSQSFSHHNMIENQNYFNYDFSRILSLQEKVRVPLEPEACRCLILKKVYNKRQKFQPVTTASLDYQYRSYSASRPHCLEFNLKEIKEDFSQFGQILEITPAVSRKLCIVVHYYDIQSAILAKIEKEKTKSKFADRYSDWVAWYGKDPADKPCIKL